MTSSVQTEGAPPASDVAAWERADRLPASGHGNGFATRYADDLALLRGLGLGHWCTSLEWARLEPSPGTHDPVAVAHYRDVLAAAIETGLATWASVHHRCTPQWFVDSGGFTSAQARRENWVRHLKWLGETFGDLVSGWMGIHHPVGTAVEGWFTADMPPGRSGVTDLIDAAEGLLLGNQQVWEVLGGHGTPVATDMNLSLFVANRDIAAAAQGPDVDGHWSDADGGDTGSGTVTDLYRQVVRDSWTGMLADGVLRLPGRTPTEVPGAAGSFDLVGFSYYSAIAVSADGNTTTYPDDAPRDDFNRAMWPEGLGIALQTVADRLPGRPLLLTGTGVATRDDALRARILDANLSEVTEARAQGVDLRGVFLTSPIDAWEWTRGFDVGFGVADRQRHLRPSAGVVRRWTSGAPGAGNAVE